MCREDVSTAFLLHTYCNMEEGKVYTARDRICTSQVHVIYRCICVRNAYEVITWFRNDPDAWVGRKMAVKATGDSSCHLFK